MNASGFRSLATERAQRYGLTVRSDDPLTAAPPVVTLRRGGRARSANSPCEARGGS